MKDNAIQLKIFYLDSTPKSIISEGKVFIYLFIYFINFIMLLLLL